MENSYKNDYMYSWPTMVVMDTDWHMATQTLTHTHIPMHVHIATELQTNTTVKWLQFKDTTNSYLASV